MPFVPATGSNYETANSYASVAYADDYFDLRGNNSWTGSDEDKQAALIRATDYIEQTYALRWLGSSMLNSILSWPRYYANTIESNIIPERLKMAVCELALEAFSGELSPSLSTDAPVKREKVDVIEVEYDTASQRSYKIRPGVSGLLSGLLSSSGINVPVVRV